MEATEHMPTILLTGATGFVGRRVLRELEARGRRVRCLVRNPEALCGTSAEVVQGDLLRPESLAGALRGVDVAVYLVHSMQGERDFEALDRQAARSFGHAARAAE